MIPKLSLAVVCFLSFLSPAHAQEGRSDVAVSAIGVFPKQSTGNDIEQNPTNSAGFLLSYRYALRAHSAVELNYSFSRNTQYYTIVGSTSGPVAAQQGNVHEIAGAYVLEGDRSRKLNPFLLGGGGVLIFSPIANSTNATFGSSTQTMGTFFYGFGLNYRLNRGLGVRLQYRGLVYKAPDFRVSDISTGSWTHSAEPSLGLMLRF